MASIEKRREGEREVGEDNQSCEEKDRDQSCPTTGTLGPSALQLSRGRGSCKERARVELLPRGCYDLRSENLP
eukprot:274598-Hanusia_phi.AAC.1